ncbi:MAG: 3-hydroxyacyl-CoA dehydrogenase family protein [Desulfobacteraceae bacterium]|jgi:3-hydroxybutyryl-CoA dehydrogenase|nr:3-hydroxyacyl-CoA dehydrogenase family protein [Desulfobacteraceae bacterium]
MKSPEIKRVGIVGAGTMGTRIAFQCALSGKEVYLFDISPQVLDQAMEMTKGWITERADPERAAPAVSLLHPCTSLGDCLASVDLVIETVPEDLELKRQVFSEIDQLAPAHVLIGTNSSSLPSSRIAGATGRPDKVFNINFNDPLCDELLVEIMGHAETAEETMAAAEAFVRSIKLVPVITKREIMGFAFNRIWRAIKKEALHVVAAGYADFEDMDRAWMLSFSVPRGPFGRMDEIGLDVIHHIELQYYLESGDESDKPPKFLEEFLAEGRLGVKSGKGFYSYPNPEYKQPGWLRKEAPWRPEQSIKLD